MRLIIWFCENFIPFVFRNIFSLFFIQNKYKLCAVCLTWLCVHMDGRCNNNARTHKQKKYIFYVFIRDWVRLAQFFSLLVVTQSVGLNATRAWFISLCVFSVEKQYDNGILVGEQKKHDYLVEASIIYFSRF